MQCAFNLHVASYHTKQQYDLINTVQAIMRYQNTCVHNTYYSQIIHTCTCTTLCFMTIVYSPNSSTTVSDDTLSLEDSPPNTTTTTREELMVMAVMVCRLLLIMLSASKVTCGNYCSYILMPCQWKHYNVLMPLWWLQESCAQWMYYHTWLHASNRAINAA